jgi:hypothetical protein
MLGVPARSVGGGGLPDGRPHTTQLLLHWNLTIADARGYTEPQPTGAYGQSD